MTGYGVNRLENDELRIVAEIKTLNSKYLDAAVRVPKGFNSKEIEIRNMLTNSLERGKASLSLEFERIGEVSPKARVNKKLIAHYYEDLKSAAASIGASDNDLFKLATQMPMAIESISDNNDYDEDWKLVKEVVVAAIENCDQFRVQEGAKLSEKLSSYILEIDRLLLGVREQDPKRVAAIKDRITNHIEEYTAKEAVDRNRLEQELIYYIEKLDIAEELVRLKNHLDYFLEMLESADSNGKKLGFISQEIGREINTIGSKANDADIQKLVVGMKEENEKIKEQVLNIL